MTTASFFICLRDLSLSYFHFQQRGIHSKPHLVDSLLSLLPLCSESRELRAWNSLLIVRGLLGYRHLVEHFIRRCCQVGFPGLALPVFNAVENPSLCLKNLIIKSLCDVGLFHDVIFVYSKFHNLGFFSDNYTFPFVIKACAAVCDNCSGETVHSMVLRSGFGTNMVVQTGLLHFYANVGEMGNACKLLDEIHKPDVVVWNALISGYSVNGLDYEALRVFTRMRIAGVNPNISTLANLFPLCSRSGIEHYGHSLHGLSYKLGCSELEYLVPALVSVYASIDDLSAVRALFDASTVRNVAILNAVVSAYTRNNKPGDAAQVFKAMLLADTKPNMVTFVSLIPSLDDLDSVLYVESVHAQAVKYGFNNELSVVTALLSVYAKLGDITSSEFLFCNLRVRNLLTWNSMVSAYSCNGLWKQALQAFRFMQMNGYIPNSISILSIVSSLSELKAIHLGKSVHAFSIRNGIDLNLNVINAMLAFYCRVGDLTCAFSIFDIMVLKNVISWNTLISGCVDNGEPDEAQLLFHQMMQEEVNYDFVTMTSLLPSCFQCQNMALGLTIHGFAIRTALMMDISLTNALISMYSAFGELEAAESLFNDMLKKDVVSWNSILFGFQSQNLLKETLEKFNLMMEENQKPSSVTLLIALPACHTLLQVKSFHSYGLRNMVSLETQFHTLLMITYAKLGDFSSCMALFHLGDKTITSLWNTVISACLHSNDGTKALSFFRSMLHYELEPDCVTALNLISACARLKNLLCSNSVLAYLLKQGFNNQTIVSNSLIDLYAKCGSINEARLLFDRFTKRDSVTWSVMINAYALHGDGEAALNLHSEMKQHGFKCDRVQYLSILSACSHAGFIEQGKMVFESMIQDGIIPGKEHYACIVDLLGRLGHFNEAYEFVKRMHNLQPSLNLLENLLGACSSHGNISLGQEIGKWMLELNINDPRPFVILQNIYATAGKWKDVKKMRKMMQQKQLSKGPGISYLVGNGCDLSG